MSHTFTVAIVGRPNVGKSTLFNRLLGRRRAIVHDQPGVTRDRITAQVEIVPDRFIELIDTGGLVPGDDPLGLNEQVEVAVRESDLLILLVDGREGLVSADETVWHHLRPFGKPAILVVNKGDTHEAQARFGEFHRLGIAPQILVSSEHGGGVIDLRSAIADILPAVEETEEAPGAPPPIAVVGRPNVGKSSLVNKLLGEKRSLVSPVAGTTRDPVDSLLVRGDKQYLLIDTAGIRRRSQMSDTPEALAVLLARRQIERAKVAVLVVDAAQGVTSGDLAIAGSAWELGRAVVVAVNKWDLLEPEAREQLDRDWPRLEQLLGDPPRVNVSATTGRSVEKLFPAIDEALLRFETRLGTGEVNRLFETAVTRRPPPANRGRPWKMYYVTQVSTGPPTFMIFANRPLPRADSYRRYLENRLREALKLEGVPIRLVIRGREPRKEER